MDRNYKKGFTLIELLVVIAIIGILSAVVLASLSAARSRGSDAAVKSNLNNARSQAELYNAQNNYTYSVNASNNVCNTLGTSNGIRNLVDAAAKAGGFTGWSGSGSTGQVGCNAGTNAWAAWVELRSGANPGNVWCVDSSGTSGERGAITTNITTRTNCQ